MKPYRILCETSLTELVKSVTAVIVDYEPLGGPFVLPDGSYGQAILLRSNVTYSSLG